MAWTETEIQRVVAEVQRRAEGDPEFRALALRDAKAAIARISSEPIPGEFVIRCVESAGEALTIVLPPSVAADRELSDEELQLVAGGGAIGKSAMMLQPTLRIRQF